MYREELVQAKKRIEELDRQLTEHKEELAELRAKIGRRIPDEPRPHRRVIATLVAALLVAVAAGAVVLLVVRAGQDVRTGTSATEKDARPKRPLRTAKTSEPERGSSDPGFRLSVPSEDRVIELGGRCERSARSFDALPAGTKVLDFLLCSGCDCCLEGGAFPPAFAGQTPLDSHYRCRECSRDAQLEDEGLTVIGGDDRDRLRGSQGLVIHLAKPARVFGLQIAGGGFSKPWRPDYEAGMVAYDPDGRPIDAVRTTYPASKDDDERPDFSILDRELVVEGCEGETIGRVDFKSTDLNVRVKAIALRPE